MDHQLYFISRSDTQYKFSGYRVNIKDIEINVCKIKEVSQAVVSVEKYNHENKMICYYVSKLKKPSDVRFELSKLLPKYMLPHEIYNVPYVPLKISEKILNQIFSHFLKVEEE